jgi:amidohydrolase
MTVQELMKTHKPYAVALRRHFHQNPEASMKEWKTAERIEKELAELGIPTQRIAGTGVVGIIKGPVAGKTIGLRADIDALEVTELADSPYKSQIDGLMHACGHDGHTAGLLTAAKILSEMKGKLKGTVKLIFQPGEEVAKGAIAMIEAGVIEDMDAIFGLHIWNDIPAGTVSIEDGPRMASAGIFNIKIKGRGGHGSMPHQGVDAAIAGAAMVNALQSVVSREISPLDPAVVSLGIFNAGTRFNVLAEDAYLEGTTRCFSLEVNDAFEPIITRIVRDTAATYRATAELDYKQLVLPTINDPKLAAIGRGAVETILSSEALIHMPMTTGGEDFSFFGKLIPSAFAFVGGGFDPTLDTYPHHHAKFDIDERALEVAAGLYAQVALDFLSEEV